MQIQNQVISKVDSPAELRDVWMQLSTKMRQGPCPQEIQDAGFTVEEYFEGAEVDIDGSARNGKLEVCLVADNHPALEPHFLEVGGTYPSQLPAKAVTAIEKLTAEVVLAFPGVHWRAYMKCNGEFFHHYIRKYYHKVGTKFDVCGTKFDELGTKYNPEVIEYRPL